MSLSLSAFAALSELIVRRSGLLFEMKSRAMLERRLSPRLLAHRLSSFEDYIQLLQRNGAELDEVYQILTTKETYFFRQDYQLRAFLDEIVPRLAEANSVNRRLTIWSAGCSSGEEAYTLAMMLSESPLLMGFRTSVVGTDLCRSNIETAERGLYRAGSFRAMNEDLMHKHFTEEKGGLQIKPALRRMVHFSVGNLLNARDVRSVGRVDAVFCRNVLIYFDDAARQAVTGLFYERLLPGGYLLLGHSESLLNAGTRFEAVHLEADLVYRRPPLESSSASRIKVSS
jgi:chemotaxis protein methyltransferase CheR